MFLFLPIAILGYFLIPILGRLFKFKSRTLQNFYLVLLSLGFYTWGGTPRYVLILIASIILNYFMGRWMEKARDEKKMVGFVEKHDDVEAVSLKRLRIKAPMGVQNESISA